MKVIIVNEKQNTSLKRKELEISIEHIGGATPSMAGLQLLLSREFNLEPEKIEIRNIFSLKGRQRSRAKTFIWDEKKVENLAKPKEAPKEGTEQKIEG